MSIATVRGCEQRRYNRISPTWLIWYLKTLNVVFEFGLTVGGAGEGSWNKNVLLVPAFCGTRNMVHLFFKRKKHSKRTSASMTVVSLQRSFRTIVSWRVPQTHLHKTLFIFHKNFSSAIEFFKTSTWLILSDGAGEFLPFNCTDGRRGCPRIDVTSDSSSTPAVPFSK